MHPALTTEFVKLRHAELLRDAERRRLGTAVRRCRAATAWGRRPASRRPRPGTDPCRS
ncbi:hypothetical protein [Sphaerisporangium album]|uniref:hypothetical protein n=1 Tax=Sphaerisporangium album TaxID=509200 RepID=UPI0015F09801|nr:hypothetical protein [Sphaerisporangium album]